MRLATIVSASYGATPSLPFLAGPAESARAFYGCLSAPDAGFAVEWFEGRREFPEELEQLLGARPVRATSILFYFAGYVLAQPGRSPALALDGPRARAYPLPRLCDLLARFSDEYLMVLDLASNTPARRPEALADAVCATLAQHYPSAGGLVSVKGPSRSNGSAGFTQLALRHLEGMKPRLTGAPATSTGLFEELEVGAAALARTHAIRYVPSGGDFVILPAARVDPAPTAAVNESSADVEARAVYLQELAEQARWFFEHQDWRSLAGVYESMLDYAEGDYLHEIAARLGSLARLELADPSRAISPLERLVAAAVPGAALRFELTELYTAMGQLDRALEHCLGGLRWEPREPLAYRRAAWIFSQMGEPDRTWNAASVLRVLGAADADEQALADERRPEGLLPASAALTADDWSRGLARPDRYPPLEEVIRVAGYAAITHRLQVLTKQRRAPKLDPAERQDLKQSTTMLCRSLTWTARLLALPTPALYVRASESAEMIAAPAAEPSALVSKFFASGLTLPELAFLWGRHLTSFRPDHYILVYFPSVGELISFVRACGLASHWDPKRLRDEEPETARLAAHLHRSLPDADRAALGVAMDGLPHPTLKSVVESFIRASGVVAHRAGLLACGDVGIAAETMARFPVEQGTADPVADLLLWAVGDACAGLRRKLGVAG